ncbi:hypothetical protein Y033_5371 [Burkholderia pseudomallei MSHR435]|nr:hypothetical protein DO65_4912 [Burkholderia pseudomallei]KGX79115.1 hypothetical protein Y033_5371 [Burkholderia pseudomallei MSHR435]
MRHCLTYRVSLRVSRCREHSAPVNGLRRTYRSKHAWRSGLPGLDVA